ncbi:WecB/TagA/CpsF family glycosyltransferase [Brevibacillus sp. TJ4]|uniref:WecB/TagA/CpsF family glycosyltransferase n=1 Tax=Brevibacillus sp. TJ4 TaxID=3234853 RepID=UPI0037D5C985
MVLFAMINYGIYPLLGIRIAAVDYEYAVQQIMAHAREEKPLAVSALAVHGVMCGFLDEMQQRRLNGLDLIVPDGQPVRWGLRLLHDVRLPERVYGPELTLRVVEAAAREGMPIYLYGSTSEMLEALVNNLSAKYPGLVIAGASQSRFRRLSPEEKREVVATIRESGAKIVLVGLGCPRQEAWVYEYREELSMPLLAVGAAFAFHAGHLPQAPHWMQRSGLEWLFRLICEPRRLWRRYVVLNPLFLWALAQEALGWKRKQVVLPDRHEREESFG